MVTLSLPGFLNERLVKDSASLVWVEASAGLVFAGIPITTWLITVLVVLMLATSRWF